MGKHAAAGKPHQLQEFARIIGLHVEADRTVGALAIVEDQAGGLHVGAAHRADVQCTEIHAVGPRLQVERHVLRGDAVHLQFAGLDLEAQVRRIGARQDDGQHAPRSLLCRGLHRGNALRRIGVEVEAAALDVEIDRTAARRRDGEGTLARLAIELELALGEPQALRREAEAGLQLEAAAVAGPQGAEAVAQAGPQPQDKFAQVIGFESEVARQFAAARRGEVAALEQHLAAPRQSGGKAVDAQPVAVGGNGQFDVVEVLALALEGGHLDAALEAHVPGQQRQQSVDDGEAAGLAQHVARLRTGQLIEIEHRGGEIGRGIDVPPEAQRGGARCNGGCISGIVMRHLDVGEVELVEVAPGLGGEDKRAQLAFGIALAVVAGGGPHRHVALHHAILVGTIEAVDRARIVRRLEAEAEEVGLALDVGGGVERHGDRLVVVDGPGPQPPRPRDTG